VALALHVAKAIAWAFDLCETEGGMVRGIHEQVGRLHVKRAADLIQRGLLAWRQEPLQHLLLSRVSSKHVLFYERQRSVAMEQMNRGKPLGEVVPWLPACDANIITIEKLRIEPGPLLGEGRRPELPNLTATEDRSLAHATPRYGAVPLPRVAVRTQAACTALRQVAALPRSERVTMMPLHLINRTAAPCPVPRRKHRFRCRRAA
jgi:hypothetical protein